MWLDLAETQIETPSLICRAIELSVTVNRSVAIRRARFVLTVTVFNNRFQRKTSDPNRDGHRSSTKRQIRPLTIHRA
jgi:hypothetical protein